MGERGLEMAAMERERGAGEAAFRVLFEHGSDPAVVLERGAVVDANPLALRALAYARGELVGLSTRALFVEPEALAELRAALDEHGLVRARALALRRGDGARLDALVTAARLAEAPARWIVIVRPRVAVEPQAPAGAGLLEAIIENTSAVIYVKDLEGRVLLVNRRYETALGLRRADVIGGTDYDFFPREIAEQHRQHDLEVLAVGASREWEEHAPHDDGVHTYISVKFPIVDAAGRAYAVGGISTDITERKRAEASLRESEARTRELFDQTQTALAETEAYARRLAALNELGECVNLAERELEVFTLTAALLPWIVEADAVRFSLRAADTTTFEVFVVDERAHGRRAAPEIERAAAAAWLATLGVDAGAPRIIDELRGSPREGDPALAGMRSMITAPMTTLGEIIGSIEVARLQPGAYAVRDANLLMHVAAFLAANVENKRRTLELRKASEAAEMARAAAVERSAELARTLESLRATQQQLVESEKMAALGGLVAGVAHEINTPIGVGVTGASLLEQRTRELAERFDAGALKRKHLRAYLETAVQTSAVILANLQRAGALIQSFKQVAVDQSSQERRRFAVVEYLENLLLSLRPELRRHPVTVEISGDAELTLVNDPGALAQVVTNLVMNSLTHAFVGDASGAIGIRVDPAPDGIELEVRDDGRGIAGEHLAKIFDPFFTTQRGRGGSGLGLHVVYNLVTQRMRGTIRCESAPGAGARFSLSLPHTPA